MNDIVPRRRIGLPALALFALLSAGCATATVGGTSGSTLPPSPTSSTAPAPSPTDQPEPSTGPEPTTSPAPEPAVPSTTSELVDACLVSVRDDNAPASEQLDRSTIRRENARSALRPDALWYVVVPIVDPTVDARLEYACLLAPDLSVDASWGRIAPEVDDFDQWSTATEPPEGM